jgi:hypothetical protein
MNKIRNLNLDHRALPGPCIPLDRDSEHGNPHFGRNSLIGGEGIFDLFLPRPADVGCPAAIGKPKFVKPLRASKAVSYYERAGSAWTRPAAHQESSILP